jgi:hypothetical protein
VRLGGQAGERQPLQGPVLFRLKARRGPQKAICAVAASILTAIHHMLKDGTFHQDLGASPTRPRKRAHRRRGDD